jgi:hypothetical protein
VTAGVLDGEALDAVLVVFFLVVVFVAHRFDSAAASCCTGDATASGAGAVTASGAGVATDVGAGAITVSGAGAATVSGDDGLAVVRDAVDAYPQRQYPFVFPVQFEGSRSV